MKRIGDGVREELARFGPAAGMADVVAAWPAAVGDGIARNAWPARIARDGTLHVATSSSAWAFELAQLAPTLLERLREHLGSSVPKALRFAPGRLPEGGEPGAAAATIEPPRPRAEDRELAWRLAEAIDDAELRGLVARAAAASLARRRSDR